MKIEIKESESIRREYPYIGIYDGILWVLFATKNAGTVLKTNNVYWRIGEYRVDFHEDLFNPFTGSITLSND
ncbi:hypothetical protein [Massilibacteroides sp.]|uniref:hypothetical protein n=1 Tax=Massilibacteroides sp. TaxID=2034766 RepID=UPI00260F7409|nr:hypothetical protein [Massilibacteroides sp.]MDD4515652.1 hypothetical protein [Massilibacteroides sp.]